MRARGAVMEVAVRAEGVRAVVAMEVAARGEARKRRRRRRWGWWRPGGGEGGGGEGGGEGGGGEGGGGDGGGGDGGGGCKGGGDGGGGQSCGEGGCRVLREGKGEPSGADSQLEPSENEKTKLPLVHEIQAQAIARALPRRQSSAMQLQSRFHCAET